MDDAVKRTHRARRGTPGTRPPAPRLRLRDDDDDAPPVPSRTQRRVLRVTVRGRLRRAFHRRRRLAPRVVREARPVRDASSSRRRVAQRHHHALHGGVHTCSFTHSLVRLFARNYWVDEWTAHHN